MITLTITQNERWLARYNEVLDFMEQNHRNPSRHRLEQHDMLNWVKANGKRINAGVMKELRMGLFRELLALAEENKHVNQYK